MKALVTGATGFVGKNLVPHLNQPHVLARNPEKAKEQLGDVVAFPWTSDDEVPAEAFEGVDVVFHLAGEPVFQRWSPAAKKRIAGSRIDGTQRVVDAMEKLTERPRVFVSASAIGFYGSRGDEVLDEKSTRGQDFLADLSVLWEEQAQRAEDFGMRVVYFRVGVVLGKGGALQKMLPAFRLGFGGRLGDGKHWMSWIHIDDIINLLLFVAKNEGVQGPINAVAPSPVTNDGFTRALARVLHRPAVLPVPNFALKLVFGELRSALMSSQRILPTVAKEAGFGFQFPNVEAALSELIQNKRV